MKQSTHTYGDGKGTRKRPDGQGEGAAAESPAQQSGEQAVVVGNAGDVAAGIAKGRHHVAQRQQAQVDPPGCRAKDLIGRGQVDEADRRSLQNVGRLWSKVYCKTYAGIFLCKTEKLRVSTQISVF